MREPKTIRNLPAGFDLNPTPRQGIKFPRSSAETFGAALFVALALLLMIGD